MLCMWPLTVNIDVFIYELNDFVPSIKFSYDVENNGCLSFLDVNVFHTNNGFKFSFLESQLIYVLIFIFILTTVNGSKCLNFLLCF